MLEQFLFFSKPNLNVKPKKKTSDHLRVYLITGITILLQTSSMLYTGGYRTTRKLVFVSCATTNDDVRGIFQYFFSCPGCGQKRNLVIRIICFRYENTKLLLKNQPVKLLDNSLSSLRLSFQL